jgi:hypothetical protein
LKRQVKARGNRPVDRENFEQSLRLIVSMPAALMRGGKWSVAQDPDHSDRVQIVVTGVAGLPEENAQATCGVLTGISFQWGSRLAWKYERPGPDRIVYRMDSDIGALRNGTPEEKS